MYEKASSLQHDNVSMFFFHKYVDVK